MQERAHQGITKKIGLYVAIFLFSALICLPFSGAAAVPVTAEGVAAISPGDDLGRVRDEAIRDALRRAVEIGVGTVVQAESLMKNYEVLRDKVWTKTKGYVVSYNVIKESRDNDFYRVTVKAMVDFLTLGQSLNSLGIEISLFGNPRVVSIVKEWVCENELGQAPTCVEQPFSVAGDEVRNGFLRAGFTVLDESQLDKISDPNLLEQAAKGDAKAAVGIARALGADLAIAGNVRVEPAGTITAGTFTWHKATATLSLQIVLQDTGEILSAVVETAAATTTSFATAAKGAIDRVTNAVLPQLVIETIAKLNFQRTEKNREIKLLVSGIHTFAEASHVVQALKAMREAEEVYFRTYDNNTLTVDIRFLGPSTALAQALESPGFKTILQRELNESADTKVLSVAYSTVQAEITVHSNQ